METARNKEQRKRKAGRQKKKENVLEINDDMEDQEQWKKNQTIQRER